ncbi:MAG: type IV secretion system protein [Rickettsiales bacterium]|nr:type IV secretion system protein [Rickettsiales bacterium]
MRKLLNHLSIFPLLITLFFICSCDRQKECIDPDDWGGTLSTSISSNDNPTPPPDNYNTVTQQTTAWKKSYELDGNRVIMVVKNNVNCKPKDLNNSSLFTETNSWLPILSEYLEYNEDIPICSFVSDTPVTLEWCPKDSSMDDDNIPASNLPCKFNYGLGLYSTLASSTRTVDNTDFSCLIDGVSTNDNNCFFHIGDNMNTKIEDSPFYSQSCPTAGVSFIPPTDTNNNTINIYFKILDRYYSDNAGGYTIEFKQGVRKSNSEGVVTKFVGLVQALLCNVTSGIYKKLVSETDFTSYIKVILVLYIIFLGLSSVMGFSQLTHKELLIRALKFGVILQLMSDTSWDFFNNYFFNFFTNGISEITSIAFGQDNTTTSTVNIPWVNASQDAQCNLQNLSVFSDIDTVINQLFSYETTRKILSLLFWEVFGFVYIAIIYICLAVVLFILMKFILIYLVSILIISILITLAPIFIPFFLFKITRSFFNNWLKALISYFVQPIVILTFAFFLLQIFVSQMQSLLGYRVCWKKFLTIPIVEIDFYAWQYDFPNDSDKKCIATPNSIYYYDTDSPVKSQADQLQLVGDLNIETYPGNNACTPKDTNYSTDTGDLCMPYTCFQNRYVDYPYLDPNFQPDKPRIDELHASSPTLVSFKDIVSFAMIIWFMYHFSNIVPVIAKQVARGNPFTGVNLGLTAGALQGAIFKYGSATITKPLMLIGSPIYKYATKGRNLRDDLRIPRQTMKGLKEYAQDAIGKKIEKTEEKISKSRPVKIAKWIVKPHEMIGEKISKKAGETLEKMGQKTFGKGMAALEQKRDEITDAIDRKTDEVLFGEKRAKLVSDKARKALQSADSALNIARNKQKEQEKSQKERQKIQEAIDNGKIENIEGANLIKKKKEEEEETKKLMQRYIQKSYSQYREAAKEGSTKAMIALGHMHEQGEVPSKADTGLTPERELYDNLSEAHNLYTNALNAGDHLARAEIGRIAQKMQSQKEILDKKGAEALKNGDEAFAEALDKKDKGIEAQDQIQKAYSEYTKAAQDGNAIGMMALGRIHEQNLLESEEDVGLDHDEIIYNNLSKAHNSYTKALEAGHISARPEIDRVTQQMQAQKAILDRKKSE